VFNWNK